MARTRTFAALFATGAAATTLLLAGCSGAVEAVTPAAVSVPASVTSTGDLAPPSATPSVGRPITGCVDDRGGRLDDRGGRVDDRGRGWDDAPGWDDSRGRGWDDSRAGCAAPTAPPGSATPMPAPAPRLDDNPHRPGADDNRRGADDRGGDDRGRDDRGGDDRGRGSDD